MKLDRVFFINLDHRTDRLSEIEGELASHGLLHICERFPGIYHETIGGVGCTQSHIEVLKLAKERGYGRVLILEDDFMFTVSKDDFQEKIDKLDDIEFDVCMLSYNLMNYAESPQHSFLYKVLEAQTASGYIVNSHYYDELINVLSEAVPAFEATNHHWIYSNDIVWKPLQKRDNWICFNPRLGKQRPSYSDCGKIFSDHGC